MVTTYSTSQECSDYCGGPTLSTTTRPKLVQVDTIREVAFAIIKYHTGTSSVSTDADQASIAKAREIKLVGIGFYNIVNNTHFPMALDQADILQLQIAFDNLCVGTYEPNKDGVLY